MVMLRSYRFVLRLVNFGLGLALPALGTLVTIESPTPETAAQWLTYWLIVVAGLLLKVWTSSFMQPVLRFFPILPELQFLAIAWLVLPQWSGAWQLYDLFLRPALWFIKAKFPQLLPVMGQASKQQILSDEGQRYLAQVDDVAESVDKGLRRLLVRFDVRAESNESSTAEQDLRKAIDRIRQAVSDAGLVQSESPAGNVTRDEGAAHAAAAAGSVFRGLQSTVEQQQQRESEVSGEIKPSRNKAD